jgi:plasmid stabilization system protein ParE
MVTVIRELAEYRGARAQKRILEHVLKRVRALADLPWAAPEWMPAGDPSFRRLAVEEYVLLYRIVAEDQAIFILAIRHGKKRPLEPDEIPES